MKLFRDIALVVVSVCVAIVLVKTGVIAETLAPLFQARFFGPLIAGLFFTSAFTSPLAIVALGELSRVTPILHVALFGSAGALIGDLVIFLFIKDTFARDLAEYFKTHPHRKIRGFFRFRLFRWLTPVLGALFIISPLPNEVGLALLGLSRMRLRILIPFSLFLNFFGILLIALIANALV